MAKFIKLKIDIAEGKKTRPVASSSATSNNKLGNHSLKISKKITQNLIIHPKMTLYNPKFEGKKAHFIMKLTQF